jgi:hypothetical protein
VPPRGKGERYEQVRAKSGVWRNQDFMRSGSGAVLEVREYVGPNQKVRIASESVSVKVRSSLVVMVECGGVEVVRLASDRAEKDS